MPGSTANRGYPYPELDEQAHGPEGLQLLAEAVDADVAAIVALPAVPRAVMLDYAGAVIPTGYLACDGSAVSRTTYADLYAALGGAASPWGQGNGSTTFNLPDYRGRVAVGVGTHTEVDAIGDSDGMATVGDRRPKHAHTVAPSHYVLQNVGTATGYAGGGGDGVPQGAITVGPTANRPVDGPAYAVAQKIIRV